MKYIEKKANELKVGDIVKLENSKEERTINKISRGWNVDETLISWKSPINIEDEINFCNINNDVSIFVKISHDKENI